MDFPSGFTCIYPMFCSMFRFFLHCFFPVFSPVFLPHSGPLVVSGGVDETSVRQPTAPGEPDDPQLAKPELVGEMCAVCGFFGRFGLQSFVVFFGFKVFCSVFLSFFFG